MTEDTNPERFTGGEALALAQKGMEAWNEWADDNQGVTIDFSGVDFRETAISFKGFVFCGEVWFRYALFKIVNFENATFNGVANFENANFRDVSNFENATFNGVANFESTKFSESSNFSGANFNSSANFENANFRDVSNFENATFNGVANFESTFFNSVANFGNIKFSEVSNFRSASFHGVANFENIKFCEVANFTGTFFTSVANFKNASFNGVANFDYIKFREVSNFEGAQFYKDVDFKRSWFQENAVFREVRFNGRVDFNKATIMKGRFEHLALDNANFEYTIAKEIDFSGTNLTDAIFTGANLLGAVFDTKTNFNGARLDDCKVSAFSLECLNEYGEISVGQRMKMDIHDDLALLRSSYSGFLQWIHFAALFAFLFPYLWFIGTLWGRAKFSSQSSDQSMPLWQALGQFIYNGGINWEDSAKFHSIFLIFVFSISYNFLRASLLFKTKSLELKQVSSDLKVNFNLQDRIVFFIRWSHLYAVSQWGFYLNLLVAAGNLAHFFTMKIPIPFDLLP